MLALFAHAQFHMQIDLTQSLTQFTIHGLSVFFVLKPMAILFLFKQANRIQKNLFTVNYLLNE